MIKLLLPVLLIIFSSCDKQDPLSTYKSVKTYTIHKDWHKADYGLNFAKRMSISDMSFAITPAPNCMYDLESEDNKDINKIYGISWGLSTPENNSFRIGWSCYKQNGLIQWFYYIHNHHVRNPGPNDPYDKTLIYESFPGVEIEFYVVFNRGMGTIDITIIGGRTTTVEFDFHNVPNTSFYCFPYFGGNNKAPHTMNILIKDRYKL